MIFSMFDAAPNGAERNGGHATINMSRLAALWMTLFNSARWVLTKITLQSQYEAIHCARMLLVPKRH